MDRDIDFSLQRSGVHILMTVLQGPLCAETLGFPPCRQGEIELPQGTQPEGMRSMTLCMVCR